MQEWKDRVFDQTQGNVDIDRRYPNLGRYLGPDFFADKAWWDEARKIFTPKENEMFINRLDNLFAPVSILFADQSETSSRYFDYLMDGNISFRVLPIDDHISEPSVGLILFDLIYTGDEEVQRLVGLLNSAKEKLNKGFKDPPNPEFMVTMQKVRQIQIERAITEMARITSADLQS